MLDFTRFEILTFDCYGTLINWEAGILSALHRILSAHGKTVDDATLLKLYGDFEQRSEQGSVSALSSRSSSRWFASLAPNLASIPAPMKCARCPTLCPAGSPGPTRSPRFASSRAAFGLAILSNVDDDLFALLVLNWKLISTRSSPRSRPRPTSLR